MAKLTWDQIGNRFYETGVDHGVLYIPDTQGSYSDGVSWNGLTKVTESPSGAAPNAQYADNIKYLNLFSAEEFSATIEAFTYPDEFAQYDGLASSSPGVIIGQQARRSFGLSYRTKFGNDIDGDDYGYKLHLIYGCSASPSQRAYATINNSPAAMAFSWSISTTPVLVPGMKPTSILTVDSTKVSAVNLAALEQILYGTEAINPALPLPSTIISMFEGGVIIVVPIQPTYESVSHALTIPSVTGLSYYIDGVVVPTGPIVIATDTLVTATPDDGYIIESGHDNDWFFSFGS